MQYRYNSFASFLLFPVVFFFFNDTATTEIYTLSLHDALPISSWRPRSTPACAIGFRTKTTRSEEHTSELQSRRDLVCRLLLEKKKTKIAQKIYVNHSHPPCPPDEGSN